MITLCTGKDKPNMLLYVITSRNAGLLSNNRVVTQDYPILVHGQLVTLSVDKVWKHHCQGFSPLAFINIANEISTTSCAMSDGCLKPMENV